MYKYVKTLERKWPKSYGLLYFFALLLQGKVIVCSKVKTLQKHLLKVRYTLENEQNQQIRD